MINALAAQAKRTLLRLRKTPQTVAAEPAAGYGIPESVPVPPRTRRAFHDYAFVEYMLWFGRFTLILNIALAVVLVLANHSTASKPVLFAKAPPTLHRLAEEFYRSEGIRFDQVATTILTILPLAHHVDDGGAPYLPLLQGMVAPDVYRELEAGIRKAMPEVKRTLAVQNLNITSITEYDVDPKTRRVSCFVRGYFSVILQQTGRPTILPYRAEVLLEQNTVGNLNPLPFTLIRRTERLGADALQWDRTRKTAKGGGNAN